ncbi:MAG: hypothetical protein KTR26_14115 [Flammeovirgaceae bacterium]|nr:hypothetical protein [Flammeovirgaceae bacterium]
MKTILLILMLSFFGVTINAQKADLEYIHSAVENRFNLELDTINLCDSYILNEIVYTKDDFRTKIGSYKKSDIKFTIIADFSNTRFFHQNCDYTILVGGGKYKQSKEEKLKELDLICENLNKNLPELVIRDHKCENCKQVVVDGEPIEMYEARTLVNNLKVKNIEFIVSYESANPQIFGRNAINGLTEIFLKKKNVRLGLKDQRK